MAARIISEIRSEIAGPTGMPLVQPSLAYWNNLSKTRPMYFEKALLLPLVLIVFFECSAHAMLWV
jgi:hypothetical protein